MAKYFQNRFDRYPGGAVPQNAHGRTPEQQLAYLDQQGFVATRERAQLAKRIETAKTETKKK